MHRITSRLTVLATLVAVAALLLAACGSSSGTLTGKAWEWTASTITGAETIADPTRYTVQFADGGTFSAKADCNQVSGSYSTTGSAITIEPGASTMAMCPEDSLGTQFVAGLGAATTWAISGGQLVLTGTEGSMTFR